MDPKAKRRQRLIKPRIQLRLTLTFVLVLVIGLVLQASLIASQVAELAATIPTGGQDLSEAAPGMTVRVLVMSLVTIVPVTVAVGVLTTFKLAGPVYRFESHLQAIRRGEDPGVCRIRKGDELQELCDELNGAIEALRNARVEEAEPQVAGEAA